MMRLLLSTSRPAGYRRGGQVIGLASAPTSIVSDDLEPSKFLAILRDENVTIRGEDEDGKQEPMPADVRADLVERLLGDDAETAAKAAADAKAKDEAEAAADKAAAEAKAKAEADAKAAAEARAKSEADAKPKDKPKAAVKTPAAKKGDAKD